jgi:hypothetical protein
MTTNKKESKMNTTVKNALEYAETQVTAWGSFYDHYSFSAPIYRDGERIGYTVCECSKMTNSYADARREYNLALLETAIWYSRTEIDEGKLYDYLKSVPDGFTKRDLPRLIREY